MFPPDREGISSQNISKNLNLFFCQFSLLSQVILMTIYKLIVIVCAYLPIMTTIFIASIITKFRNLSIYLNE